MRSVMSPTHTRFQRWSARRLKRLSVSKGPPACSALTSVSLALVSWRESRASCGALVDGNHGLAGHLRLAVLVVQLDLHARGAPAFQLDVLDHAARAVRLVVQVHDP